MLVPSVGMRARKKQRYLRTCVDFVQIAAIYREKTKVRGAEANREKRRMREAQGKTWSTRTKAECIGTSFCNFDVNYQCRKTGLVGPGAPKWALKTSADDLAQRKYVSNTSSTCHQCPMTHLQPCLNLKFIDKCVLGNEITAVTSKWGHTAVPWFKMKCTTPKGQWVWRRSQG